MGDFKCREEKTGFLPKEMNANRFFRDSHLFEIRARICRSFKETRYRFSAWRAGTKPYLSYWPARLHRLAKSIPRNRCLGSINVYKYGLWLTHFCPSMELTGGSVAKDSGKFTARLFDLLSKHNFNLNNLTVI